MNKFFYYTIVAMVVTGTIAATTAGVWDGVSQIFSAAFFLSLVVAIAVLIGDEHAHRDSK